MKSSNKIYGILLLRLIILFHDEAICAVTIAARNVSGSTRTTSKSSNLTTLDNKTTVASTTSAPASVTKFSGIDTDTSKSLNASFTPSNSTSSSTSSVLTSSMALSSTHIPSTKEADHTEKTTSAYKGIEVVAGICIALASLLIIFIVAFLARYERHREKIKKPNNDQHAVNDEQKHNKKIGRKPDTSVLYSKEADQEYVNIRHSRGSSDHDAHL